MFLLSLLTYVRPGKGAVPDQKVRDGFDTFLANLGREAMGVTRARQAKKATPKEWRFKMVRLCKSSHFAALALARGGWAQLTEDEVQKAEPALTRLLSWLDKFDVELTRREKQTLSPDGRLTQRARLSAEYSRRTFELERRRLAQEQGFDLERSIRHRHDRCKDCIEQEAKGWSSIGTLTPVGQRQCLSTCKCRMEYHKEVTDPFEAIRRKVLLSRYQ